MSVNLYDDCKVSLRQPHGNGDLDVVQASYTRRKANVTEAFGSKSCLNFVGPDPFSKLFVQRLSADYWLVIGLV